MNIQHQSPAQPKVTTPHRPEIDVERAKTAPNTAFDDFATELRKAENKPEEQPALPDSKESSQKTEQPHLASGKANYSINTAIGDSAIAFTARAIVAPASVASRTQSLAEIESGNLQAHDKNTVVTDRERLRLFSPTSAIARAPVPGADASLFIAARLQRHHDTIDRALRAVAPTKTPIPLSNNLQALAPTNVSPQSIETSKISNPARSAPMQPPVQKQTGNPLMAHILAQPFEYRVIIRGSRLSPNEKELFIRNISAALSQYGLPFHPLHLMLPINEV